MQTRTRTQNRRGNKFIALALVAIGALIGVASAKARGATVGGYFNYGGFNVSYSGSVDNHTTTASLDVSAPVTENIAIDSVSTQFYTDTFNVGYGHGFIGMSGRKNVTPNPVHATTGSYITIGGVTLSQNGFTDFYTDYFTGVLTSTSFGTISVGPSFDLVSGELRYDEQTFSSGDKVETYFDFYFNFTGKFTDPELGRPFVRSVPSSGTCGLLGLSGLVSLRRRRRAA